MSGRLCWICSTIGALAAFSLVAAWPRPAKVYAQTPIRVLAWSERTEPADVYPQGINGAVFEALKNERDMGVKLGNLSDPEQGLSEAMLMRTDVLVWFGHMKHSEVTRDRVERVVRRVEEGMGFLPLHSAHYSSPFQDILVKIAERRGAPLAATPGKWGRVRDEGKPELIHVLVPAHPIARGVKDFTIPKTETYSNPFNVPAPDVKIFEGRYEGGQQDGNDGLLWNFGRGKVFYFSPGHEAYPIYFQPEVQRILRNVVRFLGARTS